MSVLNGPGEGTWSVFAQKVVEERDALREEVAKLRAERRQLRARLVECLPWVGVRAFDFAKISEVRLVRNLANDTLEEVK
jgi:uncharacterized coiled-coil DUF342 family protein